MCGILFRQYPDSKAPENDEERVKEELTWTTLTELNSRRGPSSQNLKSIQCENNIKMDFYGAVLHLRGDVVCPQPHFSQSSGNVLLWNGEVFDGLEVGEHDNDGRVLMLELEEETHDGSSSSVLRVMEKLEGPYAFVFWHNNSGRLYFGRDCLGRRSMLWHHPSSPSTTDSETTAASFGGSRPTWLTSVGYSADRVDLLAMSEVPADGIYSISMVNQKEPMVHFPWVGQQLFDYSAAATLSNDTQSLQMRLPFERVNTAIPTSAQLSAPFPEHILAQREQAHPTEIPEMTKEMDQAVNEMIQVLGDSVMRRVRDIPRTGLVHEARVGILFSGGLDCLCLAALADRFLPKGEAIDLLNVGFENPRSEGAKKVAQEQAAKKLWKQQQNASRQNHAGSHPNLTANPGTDENNSDSNIDQKEEDNSKYNVPDRITGRESLIELQKMSPDRPWNFVEINIPFEEATGQRSEILERIAPLDTVMDLSIAMAFWFASRGVGRIRKVAENPDSEMVPYSSQAKVLLSGLGADEQLGGYSRHKDQFKSNSWEGLIQELQLDLDRISTRNLGRDDRIISDHGKEVRYPFLCTNVIQFLCRLRVDLKVDLRYPRGVGEKILLRNVARRLGLTRSSSHWKRAVQFGARTAKMTGENRKEIGQQTAQK